jgi:hypothetical protein
MSDSAWRSLTVATGQGRSLRALVTGPEEGAVLVFHTGSPAGLVPLPPALEPSTLGVRTAALLHWW